MRKIWNFLKSIFTGGDPYFHIANVMWLEGYTDFEINLEIDRLKRADENKLK